MSCINDCFLYVTTILTKFGDCNPFSLPFLNNYWAALSLFSVFSDNLFILDIIIISNGNAKAILTFRHAALQ